MQVVIHKGTNLMTLNASEASSMTPTNLLRR